MWTSDVVHYKYRNRYWLLFHPVWRTQEIYGNFKKRVRLSEEGIAHSIDVTNLQISISNV